MQPAQPVTARVAETARPVVIERVVSAHLAVGVDLEAGLLDATAGAAINPRKSRAAGYLPALAVGGVIGSAAHAHRRGDIPPAAHTLLVLPLDRGRRLQGPPRPDRGLPGPGAGCPDHAQQ